MADDTPTTSGFTTTTIGGAFRTFPSGRFIATKYTANLDVDFLDYDAIRFVMGTPDIPQSATGFILRSDIINARANVDADNLVGEGTPLDHTRTIPDFVITAFGRGTLGAANIKAAPVSTDGTTFTANELWVAVRNDASPNTATIIELQGINLTGERGEAGQDGEAGPAGQPGADGQDGSDGRDGETGPAGQPGSDGADGRDGEDGEAGPAGQPGSDGADGRDGEDGEAGPAGQPGSDGADGRDGEDGEAGPAGQPGSDGADGQDGQPGSDGQPGPAGQDGQPGTDGRDGEDGDDGADGQPGPAGQDGQPGSDGQDGADGRDGVDGADGEDGEPGPEGPTGPRGERGLSGGGSSTPAFGRGGPNRLPSIQDLKDFLVSSQTATSTKPDEILNPQLESALRTALSSIEVKTQTIFNLDEIEESIYDIEKDSPNPDEIFFLPLHEVSEIEYRVGTNEYEAVEYELLGDGLTKPHFMALGCFPKGRYRITGKVGWHYENIPENIRRAVLLQAVKHHQTRTEPVVENLDIGQIPRFAFTMEVQQLIRPFQRYL